MEGKVKWMSKATGYRGEGSPLDKEVAHRVAHSANIKYPEITHWVETAKEGFWEQPASLNHAAVFFIFVIFLWVVYLLA